MSLFPQKIYQKKRIMSSTSVPPLPGNSFSPSSSTNAAAKPVIHINIGEVGTYARIGQLQPTYAFNLDIATRRSAKDIARDRLYDTGFPRVTRGFAPDAEMIETARRSVSARGPASTSTSTAVSSVSTNNKNNTTTTSPRAAANNSPTKSAKDLARELDAISGGGGFNLSLLSSSRYFHSAQSTLTGQSEVSKNSPRNSARKFIQQQSQLPYGREAFDGISDTADSLYDADFSRRYKLNAPGRYGHSIEVLKNENRPNLRNLPIAPLGTTHSQGLILVGAGGGNNSVSRTSTSSSSRGIGNQTSNSNYNYNQNASVSGNALPKYYTQTPRGREQMSEIMTKGLPRRETATISSGYF